MVDVNIPNILYYKMFKDICYIFLLKVKKITPMHNFIYIKRMWFYFIFSGNFYEFGNYSAVMNLIYHIIAVGLICISLINSDSELFPQVQILAVFISCQSLMTCPLSH